MEGSEESTKSPDRRESSIDSDDEETAVQAMVLARGRRSNAGNRMSSLIALAEADDQERVIYGDASWEETADDLEFGGLEADAPDDVSLESSSDGEEDEDDEDDDEGEKELKKLERAEKTKKRKDMANPFAKAAARKRVKLDTPSHPVSQPRAKRKSERDSWIPTPDEGPVRQSSRRQTMKNKEDTHARLLQKEKTREKVVKLMEAANRRKEDLRAKPLSQAEKLAMAAKIEKENSKSLNRWEEAENRRAEEQQARLDALRNRTMTGPFLRYWSGPGTWKDDKLVATGVKARTVQEVEPASSQPQEPLKQETAQELMPSQSITPNVTTAPKIDNQGNNERDQRAGSSSQQAVQSTLPSQANSPPLSIMPSPSVPNPADFLNQTQTQPISLSAGIPQQEPMPDSQNSSQNAFKPTEPTPLPSAQPNMPTSTAPTAVPYPNTIMFAPPQPENGFLDGILDWASYNNQPGTVAAAMATPAPPVLNPQSGTSVAPSIPMIVPVPIHAPPKPPPVFRRAARNLISLENFDKLTLAEKEMVFKVFLQPAAKPSRYLTKRADKSNLPPQILCAITAHPARYRDPATGLPYRDKYAYKCIQRLVGGSCQWSSVLECYVGASFGDLGGRPAAGVPERFFNKNFAPTEAEPSNTVVAGTAPVPVPVPGATREAVIKSEEIVAA